VLVGNNDGTVDTGIFVVGGETEEPEVPEVQYEEIVVGDVNDDAKVNVSDYSFVLTYAKKRKADTNPESTNYTANTMVKKTTADGTYYIGDVNADDKVNVSDYSFVLTYAKKRKADTNPESTNYTANTNNKINVVVE
jgi:hypothetical protein